jgi:eukaryotic-like serine/threonine-protein kinase
MTALRSNRRRESISRTAHARRSRPLVSGTLLLLLVGVLCLPMRGASAGAAQTDWPKYHFDLGNTGFNPDESTLDASNVGTLHEDWEFATMDRVDSPPSVVSGIAYFGSGPADGRTYAVDTTTAQQVWSRSTPGGQSVATAPAVANGIVYVGAVGTLYALDAITGKIRWKLRSPGSFGSPAVANGVVFAATDDTLYARDAATGKRKWSFQPGATSLSTPALAGGMVYVSVDVGDVYALDEMTGAVEWSSLGGVNASAPVVVGDMVVVSAGRYVTALDATDGSFRWSRKDYWSLSSDPTSFGGLIYFSAGGRHVFALKASNGKKAWTSTAADSARGTTGANGLLYVGCHLDTSLCALKAATGKLVSTYAIDGKLGSAPTVVNGHVYFGDDAGMHELGLP